MMLAVARPMPAPAAVIRATLPSNLIVASPCRSVGPASRGELLEALEHKRANGGIDRDGGGGEASDDLLLRERAVAHEDRRQVPHRRLIAGVDAEVPVASLAAPGERALVAGLVVAQLERHDGIVIGEPDHEVEIVVDEPSPSRLVL